MNTIQQIKYCKTVTEVLMVNGWDTKTIKALVRDRHGIKLAVTPEIRNNFRFIFDNKVNRGKYISKVSPEQLRLNDCSITYNCKIQNTRSDPIYITAINLLHPSTYFTLVQDHDFGLELDTFLQLQPAAQYSFKIIFTADVLTPASYKIPVSCDFQTVDNKNSFTIVRSFLTIMDDQQEVLEAKIKSPFTSKPWIEVATIIPTTKETNYVNHYSIPEEYMRILKYGLRPFSNMSASEDTYLRDICQTVDILTRENYNKFWHIMLWMEETAQALMLTKYNMEKVKMEIKNNDILVLEVPGLAEKRPSVIVGDFIKIRLTGDHTAYKGFVSRVNDKTVEISHVDDEIIDYVQDDPTIEYDVSFMLSRLAFERMHHAVDKITNTNRVAILFPRRRENCKAVNFYNLADSDFYNKKIVNNYEQRNAVLRILNSTHSLPYIVFGPPGTGKTVTIIEAILQIKRFTKKSILVCAPANSACDVIAKKLMPHCSKEELIRIHSSTREKTTLTSDLIEFSNVEDEEFTRTDVNKLLSFRIVVTTLTLIGRYARDYHPDCVFIDEAAQASEPETDIAISLQSYGQQVVLAGDPKQLGPMVTECAAKLGLGTSLLERLMTYDIYLPNPETKSYNNNFITMLKLNFRSHPDILSIPNHLFYEDNLEAKSVLAVEDPIANRPIYPEILKKFVSKKKNIVINSKGGAMEFCSVSSKEKREGSSPSFFNAFEVEMVVKYVDVLLHMNLPSEHKVKQDDIGIVTPYKRQVHKILESLRFRGFQQIEVGTTESFQGREKRVIIISTVRAQHALLLHDHKYKLGFVKQDQRFNVAVTRAISKLIVIGCPLVLKTDEKWEMFMQWCSDHNTYFGNHFEAKDDMFKNEVLRKMLQFRKTDTQYNHHH